MNYENNTALVPADMTRAKDIFNRVRVELPLLEIYLLSGLN